MAADGLTGVRTGPWQRASDCRLCHSVDRTPHGGYFGVVGAGYSVVESYEPFFDVPCTHTADTMP